jgi:PAS domain S-box-containing protein
LKTVKDEGFRVDDNFYRLLVESLTGYAIFTTDQEGDISSWNGGAQKLFGYQESEVLGRKASIIFRKEEVDRHKLKQELLEAVAKGRVVIERYHVRQDGSRFWASGLIFPLNDEKAAARGFTFIVRDLTEKADFEKRKDSFISTATHELKSPVTSLKLYAEIVAEEIKRSKNKVNIQSVVALNKQVDKIVALMDYLLDVDKIKKGELQLKKKFLDMNALIEETIATLQLVSKKHTIVQGGRIAERVYGDRDRLAQVLVNLITNAIKYSPGADKVIVSGSDDAHKIVVSVKDFGFGIAEAEQPEIFGRFYRASGAIDHKIEGIGLGLYVAKQIIVAHNGKMWLESEKDKGSSFYFSLPQKV